MHISKEDNPYLPTLLVQGAQHILGPFGVDSDRRRWDLKLAERSERAQETSHLCHVTKGRCFAASFVVS